MSHSRLFKATTEGDICPARSKPAALRRANTEQFLKQMQEIEVSSEYKKLMKGQARVEEAIAAQRIASQPQLEVRAQLLGDLLSGKRKQENIHDAEECQLAASAAAPMKP